MKQWGILEFVFVSCIHIFGEWYFSKEESSFGAWCEQKMDERSRNEASPQLLDLISNEREWQMNKRNEGKSSEERKLELRLGPPGEDWSLGGKMKNTEREESLLSLGCFSPNNGFQSKASPWPNYHHHHQGNNNKASSSSFLQCPKVVVELQNGGDGKVFSPSSANTAVSQPNTSQKRYSSFSFLYPCFVTFRQRIFIPRVTLLHFFFFNFLLCLWSMQTNLYLLPYDRSSVSQPLVALECKKNN